MISLWWEPCDAWSYTKGRPVKPCICLSPPDMMAAIICSALLTHRGAGLGISISSLTSPGWCSLCSLLSYSSRYRAPLARVCRLDPPPKTSSSRDSRSFIRNGSSASANCSARSPVSLQENSEPRGDDREKEDRRPCFSSDSLPSSAAECEFGPVAGDDKVRRGILAGRREGFGEGMVKIVELFCSSPICVLGQVVKEEDEKWRLDRVDVR